MREKSCGAVVFKGNSVLIVKQKNGVVGFPKGHVENNETELETVYREVKEETNVDIDIIEDCRYMITYCPKENVIKDVVYFLATCTNDNIIIQEEEIEYAKWILIDDILDMLTYKQTKDVFEFVLDYKKNKENS